MKKHIVLGAIALLTLAILTTGAFAESATFNLGQYVPVFEQSGASSAKPTLTRALAEPINLGQYVL